MHLIVLLLSLLPVLLAERNVALGKFATQSSNYNPNICLAQNAIDGNSDGNYFSGSITHTQLDSQAWWQVDLGYSGIDSKVESPDGVIINKIKVHNRIDSYSERLNDFHIKLIKSDGTVIKEERFQSIQQTYTWSFAPLYVRYVKIVLNGANYLSLAEVEVLQTSSNLALGKTATQSSNYDYYNGFASMAVDGKTDGAWPTGISHTKSENAWWKVDLGSASSVTQVIVHNRFDYYIERLDNFVIKLIDSSNNVIVTSPAFRGQSQQVFSWTFNPVNGVHFVQIQLLGVNYLSLAEVEVIGAKKKTNVALNAPTDQSSEYLNVPSDPRAVDGNTGGDWAGNSISHTLSSTTQGSYWQVTFPQEQDISKIIIYNRLDSYSSRLIPATVQIQGSVENPSLVFGSVQQQMTWSRRTKGVKSIRVTIPTGSDSYLHLAEVEVYHAVIPNLIVGTIQLNTQGADYVLQDLSSSHLIRSVGGVGGVVGITVGLVLAVGGLILVVTLLVMRKRSLRVTDGMSGSDIYQKFEL